MATRWDSYAACRISGGRIGRLVNTAEIITALGGLAGLSALIIALSERKKKHAEYSTQISETAMRLIAPLRAQIDEYARRIDELEREVRELREANQQLARENGALRDWAERLVHQIQSLGATPVPLDQSKSR